MAGLITTLLVMVCLAGGCFYGIAYLRAKSTGKSVTSEVSSMISKMFGLE
jgi:hypothetical protein